MWFNAGLCLVEVKNSFAQAWNNTCFPIRPDASALWRIRDVEMTKTEDLIAIIKEYSEKCQT
jgi:hypothetical protein